MIEDLLEAIYASPDDDAPRLVYADALLERGDPRGEFIVRQCNGDPANDLLEEHGDRWLGELAPCLRSSTFERGFLTRAEFHDLGLWYEVERVIGHPALRTVRTLAGPVAVAIHPTMTALRVLQVPQLPIGRGPDRAYRPELLSGAPRQLVELHYTVAHGNLEPHELALAECTALPHLRRLVLYGEAEPLLPLLGGSILGRVPLVEIRQGRFTIAISAGVASFSVSRTVTPQDVLALVAGLPADLAIEAGAWEELDRQVLEQALGKRLR